LLLEHRLRHKDGHWVHLMARGQVVARDAAGRALRMTGTDVDRSEQKRLELAVQQSQALLQNLTDQVPAELFQFRVDADGGMHFSYVSKYFLDFYGLTLAQVQRDAALVFAWQHADDVARTKLSIQQAATHLTPWQPEYRLHLPDGTVRWHSGHAVPQKCEDGSVVFHGAIFDITERKQAEEAQRVAAVAFESTAAMVVSSADLRILQVNHAFVELTGYSLGEAVGRSSNMLRSGRHAPAFYQAMWHSLKQTGHWEGELWNRRKNGDVYPDWLSITVVKDTQGQVTHYVSMRTDISLRKKFEEDIRKLAFFDPLTQLPNRRLLLDRLQQLSAVRARSNQVAAVLFLDLDRFKLLNDSYGHDQGDELLIQVAQRLQACVREIDTVARLGGDEFVVALAQLSDDADLAQAGAQAVANKILQALAQPFVLPEVTWSLSASIGVALLVNARALPEDLLKQADMAMYQAKAAGRNGVHFFSHRSRQGAG
jgi:diguanylate cyclase (GGDEF)-like protein/PAS domain S-box-containing protein